MTKFGTLLLLAATCWACQPTTAPAPAAVLPDVQPITQAVQLVPALATIDSVLFVFYNEPYTGDAERYTRFYKELGTTTDTVLRWVQRSLSIPYTASDTLRSCRSEGKIFCFAGGRPVQTLYFSRQSNACTHLFLIHEGRYYYWQPGTGFFDGIDALKPQAR